MTKTGRIITATLLTIATAGLIVFAIKKTDKRIPTYAENTNDIVLWQNNTTDYTGKYIWGLDHQQQSLIPSVIYEKHSFKYVKAESTANYKFTFSMDYYFAFIDPHDQAWQNIVSYGYLGRTNNVIRPYNFEYEIQSQLFTEDTQIQIKLNDIDYNYTNNRNTYQMSINIQIGNNTYTYSMPTPILLNLWNTSFNSIPPYDITDYSSYNTSLYPTNFYNGTITYNYGSYLAGYENGYTNGYNSGYQDGLENADTSQAYQDGYDYGYATGWNDSDAFNHPIALQPLLLNILTMPFTFISQAFNVTLWEGTPYAFNFANFIKGIIAIATILFIIKLFTSGFSVIGNYTGQATRNQVNKSQVKLNKAKTEKIKKETK